LSFAEPDLIRSKLVVPSSSGLLHRPRVFRSIKRGLECKLTLVSAPAGYGKTSALVDFAQHISAPVCWYTADERDRDVGVFVRYLIGAIGERFPGFGERSQAALDALSGDLFRDPTGAVGDVVNEMIEIDSPFVVVVDNYDAVDGAFGIRAFVHRLLEVIPSNCHLMFGGRVLPDLPVARLVAKHQLVGLTAEDLRFVPREIHDLLKLFQIEATKEQVETLAALSEGWITGIMLLADSLREETGAALLSGEQATAEAYGFLAKEVLNRQPPDVQHFLRVSSVLREMSPRLCREVLKIDRARRLLMEVEQRNLFVISFGDGGESTYRYHNLFRDFLHEQLRQHDPTLYADLHLSAARRFERNDDVEEAVYHYLAAEAHSQATALMERVAMEWFARGRVETLLRWADELSDEDRVRAAWLSLYQSKVLTDRYDYMGARRALTCAEAGFADRGDEAFLARVRNQRAALALFEGRYEDVITEARTALEMLGPGEKAWRAQAQRLIGRAYVGLGRFTKGIDKLRGALALYRQASSPYDVVNLLQDLGVALIDLGRFDEAAISLNEALAIARRLGASRQLAGTLNDLGWFHYLRGEYRKALILYEEGLAAARRGDDVQHRAYILVGLADLHRDLGDYGRAETLYDAGLQIARGGEPSLTVYTLAAQADMYRWMGDQARARFLLDQACRLAEEKGLDFERRGLLPASKGIALAESGEVEAGIRSLHDAVEFLEQRRARRELARTWLLAAKAHFLDEDEEQAVTALRRALELVDEIGVDHFVVVEGRHAEGLLRLGVDEGLASCVGVIEKVRDLRASGEDQLRVGIEEEEEADEAGYLKIYALGKGRVVCDGQEISSSDWQAAVAKELFFYILMRKRVDRGTIGLAFWPDLPTDQMVNRLHVTIYRLRRALGSDVLVVEEGVYRLGDVSYWFDVQEFESLIERARLLPPYDWQAQALWQRAVSLYGGDFLSSAERAWCVSKRVALREMYLEALIGVGQCHEARREFEGAIDWYRRALEVDELREDVHRHIMRCYAEAGRHPDAAAQYRRCCEILRQELEVGPSADTRRLYEQIVNRARAGAQG